MLNDQLPSLVFFLLGQELISRREADLIKKEDEMERKQQATESQVQCMADSLLLGSCGHSMYILICISFDSDLKFPFVSSSWAFSLLS